MAIVKADMVERTHLRHSSQTVITANEYRTRISAFITQKFPLVKKRKVGEQDSLIGSGVMDSLGILDVVHYLEGEFGVQISDEELVPENFESVCSIAAFVANKAAAERHSQA
jgi:acyl carrier protein